MVRYLFEYITSLVSVLNGDGIGIHVVNDSIATKKTRVIIYHDSGAGAVVSYDSGDIDVNPTAGWGLGYPISTSGEYWLRIKATSESIIPKSSFERHIDSTRKPRVSYLPNDFAKFKLIPTKRRKW